MVLKNFIQYLINKYLKNYVERLDYEKLNYSLKNGNVLLENLRLKPEALAYLNIPVTVAAGYIERLKLTIPWKHLSSRPTEVIIDGFYLLIVSKNEYRQDLREHYANKMIRVQQKVDKLRNAALDKAKIDSNETDFIERMRLQIKQNLVLKIENLHICYERKSSTKLGHPFSFGITLHYLELTTANNVRLNKQIKGNILLIYKIKNINSLSIYWNTKCKSRLKMPFKDILNDLKSKIATNNYIPNDEDMNYILRPVNLVTESVIILKPKEHYYERSRIIFDIQIEQMNFHIDSKQISDILDFIKFQNYTTNRDRCREYRDLLSQASFGDTDLTQEQQQRIHFLESKLDVFHLAYIRHKVEMEMYFYSPVMEDNNVYLEEEIEQTPVSPTTQPTNSNKRSYHRWNSLSKVKNKLNSLSKVLDHVKTTTTTKFTQNEKDFFFEDLPKLDVEIKLKKVKLNLLSTITNISNGINDEIIACISIIDAGINFKRMSLSPRIECLIDFQSIQIFGMGYNKQHRPPSILEMFPSSFPHLHVEFELFPEDQKSDYRLHLTIEPLKIIYDAPTINRFVECFQSNSVVVVHPKKKIKQRTLSEMERDFPHKKIFDMKINLKGISFLLPQYGVYQQGFSMIRLILGNFLLKSCLDDDENNHDKSLFHEKTEEQQFYKKYKLELNDLRILYSLSNKTRLHLLRRTSLIDINFYKCVYSDDANLIKWRVGIKTVIGEIYLSKIILTKLLLHLNSIPLLYSDIHVIIKRINYYLVVFSAQRSLTIDLLIYNSCLRLLMHPQRSIRTDLHINISKKRNENSIDKHAIITLNEPTMIINTSSLLKQSSQALYRNEQIKLIYSNSIVTP